MTTKNATGMAILDTDAVTLVRMALESEIEHLSDYIRESTDEQEKAEMRLRFRQMSILWQELGR